MSEKSEQPNPKWFARNFPYPHTAFASGRWADGTPHDSFTDVMRRRDAEAWAMDYLLSRFGNGGSWTTGVNDKDGKTVFALVVENGVLVDVIGYVPEYADDDELRAAGYIAEAADA